MANGDLEDKYISDLPSDQPDKTKKSARLYTTWRAYAYLLAVIAGSLLLSWLLDAPHGPQHWAADFVTSNFSKPRDRHYPIVLVYVSAATLDHCRLPYLSPIDRGLLAKLIKAVDNAKAKVIGLDIILDRPTEPSKDNALREAIRGTKAKVVLGAVREAENGSHFQSEFFSAMDKGNGPEIGHIYFDAHHSPPLVVSDHVIRFMEPPGLVIKLPGGREISKSFAAALAQADGVCFTPESLYIDWLRPPPLPQGFFGWLRDSITWSAHAFMALLADRIPWLPSVGDETTTVTGETETFTILSAEDVLGGGEAEQLHGKVVIIGVNFDDRDQHLTPLSVRRDDFYTGAFIHAQILAQLLDGRSISELGVLDGLVALAATGYLGYWLGRHSGRYHIWFELVSVLILVMLCLGAFIRFKFILPYNGILIFLLGGLAGGHYGRVHRKIQDPE